MLLFLPRKNPLKCKRRASLFYLKHSNARFKRALFRELYKPEEKQDTELIDTLLETIGFYNSEIAELSQNKKTVVRYQWQRAFACALAVVFLLLGVSGVAQAAGFRVWTALLKWDANYLQVDYVPEPMITANGSNNPPAGDFVVDDPTGISHDGVNSAQETEFDSLEEAYAFVGVNLGLPKKLHGFDITDIAVFVTVDVTRLLVNYTLDEEYIRIDVCVSDYIDSLNATAMVLCPATEYEDTTIAGVPTKVAQNDGVYMSQSIWQQKLYLVWTNTDYDLLCEAVATLCSE